MANLSALKINKSYKGISITEDLTQTQRKAYKELDQVAKTKNQEEVDKHVKENLTKHNNTRQTKQIKTKAK